MKMKNKALTLFLAVLLISIITLIGCKKSEPNHEDHSGHEHSEDAMAEVAETASADTNAAEQTTCPVMDGRAIDKNIFVEYNGKKVYFCCAMCEKKFNADPEKYTAKLPQFK